ncbi:MAG: metalloregulator ArsR/SmtB family transcription factor [Alphaproteobacteria bacterium]
MAVSLDILLGGLRAAGEPTRLRILGLLARAELTVSELTQILGQSQPRVSRHLKLLGDAGLIERFREGTWVFCRLSDIGEAGELSKKIVDLLPDDAGGTDGDAARLDAVRRARAGAAAAYFRANAERWEDVRRLHVPDLDVESIMVRQFADRRIGTLVDVGTGAGRMLELLGPAAEEAIGVDSSHEMLGLARANLDRHGLKNCRVRHADMHSLPFAEASVDAVTYHQVLHFADEPAGVLAEGGRILRPGGLMVVADFAPHNVESLREEHAHRRLGFPDAEVSGWMRTAGLSVGKSVHLEGDPLTVTVWHGEKPTGEARVG